MSSSLDDKEVGPPGESVLALLAAEDAADPGGGPQFDASPEALQALRDLEDSAPVEDEQTIPPVRWAADADQPDYAHALAASRLGLRIPEEFDFDLPLLKLLIEANHFRPRGQNNNILFGLRGATLLDTDAREGVDAVRIRDARPDHEHFRCILGVINLTSGKISAFSGSTVPNKDWMRNYYKIKNNIRPHSETKANILPTGCYVYRVAGHKNNTIKPAMRMSNPDNLTEDGTCTVLRTYEDLSYSHDDFWDPGTPYDNIHCAYSEESFSSAGCQTIKGADHQGPWGRFQRIIGAEGQGARLDYVLLTGRDAAIAAAIIAAGRATDAALLRACLERLRVGSEGDLVTVLQQRLGFSGTSYFGPLTKKRLTQTEAGANVPSDGIYAPADDAALGWGIFADGGSAATAGAGSTALASSGPVPSGEPGQATAGGPLPTIGLIDAENKPIDLSVPRATEGGSWSVSDGGLLVLTPLAGRDAVVVSARILVGEGEQADTVDVGIMLAAARGGSRVPLRVALAPATAPAPQPAPQSQPQQSRPGAVGITIGALRRFAPEALEKYLTFLASNADTLLARYDINRSTRRLTHFMGQIGHESGGFTIERESLYYTTPERLMRVWPARFPTVAAAAPYLRDEEKLAEKVYGGRLGNVSPGDGFKYRGRGLVQLTGRQAYAEYGERLHVDLAGNPDLAFEPEVALLIACEYWSNRKLPGERGLNAIADDDKLATITYRINGGYTNLEDRARYLKMAREIWPDDGPDAAPERIIERGDFNDDARLLQRLLIQRGLLSGTADGKFGTNTYNALRNFKIAAVLGNTGYADAATLDALRAGSGIELADTAVEGVPSLGAEPEQIRAGSALAGPEPEPAEGGPPGS